MPPSVLRGRRPRSTPLRLRKLQPRRRERPVQIGSLLHMCFPGCRRPRSSNGASRVDRCGSGDYRRRRSSYCSGRNSRGYTQTANRGRWVNRPVGLNTSLGSVMEHMMPTSSILIGITVGLCLLNTVPLLALVLSGERLRAKSRAKWRALSIVTMTLYGVALITGVTAIALIVSQNAG